MIALCKCGLDMVDHDYIDLDEPIREIKGCRFEAAGTRHRCEELMFNGYMCPRPRFHEDHGVPHGPLTGEKLW